MTAPAPSPVWESYWANILAAQARGEDGRETLEVGVAIATAGRDLVPYFKHFRRLMDLGFFGEWDAAKEPRKVIDFGAGVGSMALFWPHTMHVFNLDHPAMLQIQREYVDPLEAHPAITYMPIDRVDDIPIDDAHLFAAWSLTETTPETWEYWIERAPRLATAYVIGHERWDGGARWPWERLADAFEESQILPVENGLELVGWNREVSR